jgi:16S rRNA processing protein RimM
MDLIAIGKIRSTHGVKGFLKVRSFSGEIEHFYNLKEIHVEKNARRTLFTIEQIKPAGREILIKLSGIDSPEKGKLYASCLVYAERTSAAPLKKGEYYHADLCKCMLVSGTKVIGKVRSVWNNGNSDYLEIEPEDKASFMVPFIKEFTGEVDLDKHTIQLLDEGIIP